MCLYWRFPVTSHEHKSTNGNQYIQKSVNLQITSLKKTIEYNVLACHLEKIQKIENYPMESILSFDKDQDKTKDLFQDIYRSEKIIITIMYFVWFYPKVVIQNLNDLM